MGNGRVSRSIGPHEHSFQGIAGFWGNDDFLPVNKTDHEKF
jgi:hypothetical protein